MLTSAGILQRLDGVGDASVTVEVTDGEGFRVSSAVDICVAVTDLEGNPLLQREIEIICMSGARYARHIVPLGNSQITIRSVKGRIAPGDIGAFAIATVLSICRALNQEASIPESVFNGVFGSWRPVAA